MHFTKFFKIIIIYNIKIFGTLVVFCFKRIKIFIFVIVFYTQIHRNRIPQQIPMDFYVNNAGIRNKVIS